MTVDDVKALRWTRREADGMWRLASPPKELLHPGMLGSAGYGQWFYSHRNTGDRVKLILPTPLFVLSLGVHSHYEHDWTDWVIGQRLGSAREMSGAVTGHPDISFPIAVDQLLARVEEIAKQLTDGIAKVRSGT